MRRLMPMLALLAACAPATTPPIETPAQPPPRVQATTSGYDVTLNSNSEAMGTNFDQPVDRIWPLAVEAFTRVGLHIDASDLAAHQVRGKITLRRQLNGRSLSNYFDCGNEMTGTIADIWRVSVDARMGVGPGSTSGTSVVATMLTVTATPVEGTSTTVTQCSSKGQLEAMITSTIRKLLAAT
jgi:hypothetical protein